jgi:hypothetical protein
LLKGGVLFPIFFEGIVPKLFEQLNKGANFRGKCSTFGGRNPFQPQAALINPQQPEDFPGFFNYLLTAYITFQVMTVADVSAGYHHTIGAPKKGLQQEAVVDPAGAHHAEQTHIAWILNAGHSRQICSGIGTPVANKG